MRWETGNRVPNTFRIEINRLLLSVLSICVHQINNLSSYSFKMKWFHYFIIFFACVTVTNLYYFSSVYSSINSFSHHQVEEPSDVIVTINKTPLCKEGILQRRRKKTKERESSVPLVDLLIDGEDPYQTADNQRDCRLHHYDFQDVVTCLDQLQLNQQKEQLHFVFIGDSTAMKQCTNFRQVINIQSITTV